MPKATTSGPPANPKVSSSAPHPTSSHSGAEHRAPRLTPEPADFTSPTAVAAQYLSVWCYLPVAGAANQNVANVAGWVTAAGWTDDKSRAIGAATWAQIQADGVTTVCGPVHAAVNPEGPATTRRKFVLLRATRYRINTAGQVIDHDEIATQRRVLRAGDGRWLVDIQVLAG